MSTKDIIAKEGKVLEALMGGIFRIELASTQSEEEKTEVLAALSGKMRKNKIRILPGDKVKVEFSPHDMTRGRISYRF
jgi:translation initiation factor IF-1